MDQKSQLVPVYFSAGRLQINADGTRWTPHIMGHERSDGLWEGWLEFLADDGRPARVTDRETTQPNRAAVAYWAGGLEPVYFEGAFTRARARHGSPLRD